MGPTKSEGNYARKIKAYNGVDASREENVTVTCGSTELGLGYVRSKGAYYVLVVCSNSFKDGHEFADHVLKAARIALLPADALYHNRALGSRKIRLAFCKNDTTLEEVAERLSTMTFAAE